MAFMIGVARNRHDRQGASNSELIRSRSLSVSAPTAAFNLSWLIKVSKRVLARSRRVT